MPANGRWDLIRRLKVNGDLMYLLRGTNWLSKMYFRFFLLFRILNNIDEGPAGVPLHLSSLSCSCQCAAVHETQCSILSTVC